jgi:hypothetical protein
MGSQKNLVHQAREETEERTGVKNMELLKQFHINPAGISAV